MRKIFILANPVSGKKKALRALEKLEAFLREKELSSEVHLTPRDLNGWKTVDTNLDHSFSDLIIIGGDGTINEAVNGLKHDIPVGIIPAGSGNDYVKCLHLGKTLDQQIQTAVFGEGTKVDVGICNGRKFLNGVGVGFDGQIVADLIVQQTWIKGAAKYYYHVLKILASYRPRPFSYKTDGKPSQKPLILLCVAKGTTFGGSLKLTPHANLTSGKLHVCEVGNLSPLKRFFNIHRLQSGSHEVLKAVNFYEAEKLTIEANPQLHAHIDGEYFGSPPFEFGVLKGGLKVKVSS